MRFRSVCLSLVLLAGSVGTALADDPAALARAQAAWTAGDFATAAAEGQADGSAEGLVLAAQGTLAAACATTDQAAIRAGIDRSVALGRAAVKADSSQVAAHLVLATALGAAGRSMNMMEAQETGVAGEARGQIDAALRLAPDNALAHTALGSWHAQIIGRIGAVMGMATYGASQPVAFEALAKASELAPGSILVRFEFARAIQLMRGDNARTDVEQTLAGIAVMAPADGLDRLVQGQAARMAAALAADDDTALEAILKWPFAEPPQRANPFAEGPARDD